LGFEHQPKTEQQEQILLNAITLLKTADKIMEIPKSSQCQLKSVELESPFGSQHEEKHEHDHEEDSHSEFSVIYEYQCKHISSINLKPLFDNLPGFEHLDVQWLDENQQSAMSLSSSNSQIDF